MHLPVVFLGALSDCFIYGNCFQGIAFCLRQGKLARLMKSALLSLGAQQEVGSGMAFCLHESHECLSPRFFAPSLLSFSQGSMESSLNFGRVA